MAKYNGKWTRETLIALFNREDAVGHVAVERALISLYDRQTAAEKASGETSSLNGVGFTGADANTGTWLVETVIADSKKKNRPEGKRLLGKAHVMARKIVCKYAGTQLLEIARAKEAADKALIAVVEKDEEVAAAMAEIDADLNEEQLAEMMAGGH